MQRCRRIKKVRGLVMTASRAAVCVRGHARLTWLWSRSNCAASSSVIQLGRTPWPRVEMWQTPPV